MTEPALDDALKERIQVAYRTWLGAREFRSRRGQREMIATIARVLTRPEGERRIAAIEAGTGTGKTAAYCMAAIPIAQGARQTARHRDRNGRVAGADRPARSARSRRAHRARVQFCARERAPALRLPEAARRSPAQRFARRAADVRTGVGRCARAVSEPAGRVRARGRGTATSTAGLTASMRRTGAASPPTIAVARAIAADSSANVRSSKRAAVSTKPTSSLRISTSCWPTSRSAVARCCPIPPTRSTCSTKRITCPTRRSNTSRYRLRLRGVVAVARPDQRERRHAGAARRTAAGTDVAGARHHDVDRPRSPRRSAS